MMDLKNEKKKKICGIMQISDFHYLAPIIRLFLLLSAFFFLFFFREYVTQSNVSVLNSWQCAGVERSQHAAAEGHREDRHPDARGLSPAHTTGPGGQHTLSPSARAPNSVGILCSLVQSFFFF